MNALSKLRFRPNPQALALVVLAIHGTVVLFHQQVMWWQLGAMVIMLSLGVSHVLRRPFQIPIVLEFGVATALTALLMVSTGGTSSLFLAWLFILALYYPAQLPSPLGALAPLLIAAIYLAQVPFSTGEISLTLVIARSLLIATIGWSMNDLARRLEHTNRRQKKSLEELEQSQRYIRNLVETIPGITYVGARDGTFFMSSQVETLLGYKPQEFIDDTTFWHKCLHSDDFEAIMHEMHRKYAPGEMFACEYRMIAKDGRNVWFRDEAKVERDAEGYVQTLQGIMLDITQRKEYEAQLSYQASLVDNLFDAVVSTDKEFNIVSMNKAAEHLYGYTQVEAVGKSVGDILGNEYPTTTRENVVHDFLTTGFWMGDVTQKNKAGERFPILGSVSKVLDKQGNYIGAVAINKDMREMKKAQLALQQSERRYRDLLEQAAEGIFVTDKTLQLVLVNQTLCEMLGFSEEELLQMRVPDLIHQENLEQIPLKTEAILSGKTVKTERLLKRKDGSGLLVEGSAKVLPDGTIQTILHDISERKRAEETLKRTEAFYRAVIEKSNEGIAVLDSTSSIRYISASGKAIIEFTDEELMGQNRSDLVHPDDVDTFTRTYTQLRPEESATLEYRIIRKDGTWFWNESHFTNLLDNPAVNGYVVNYRDITERKQAEEKLKETEAFYRAITEKSNEGVLVIDGDLVIQYRNPPQPQQRIYANEEMLGYNRSDLIHPEDLATLRLELPKVQPEQTLTYTFRVKDLRGEWEWFESSITNLLDNPAINGYVVNYRNITPRKQAEENLMRAEAFYRAVTEQSNEGVLVFDKDMIIHYRSPSKLHMASFPYNDMIGKDRTDTIHPEDLKDFLLELPHLQSGQTLLNTFRTQNEVGTWDWFESRVTNLLGHPAVNGYVANYYNINERKGAEAVQRNLSQRLLNVQEEERRSLARELHDEIGQSLTAIKVGLQTAQHLRTPETLTDALRLTDTVLSQVRELSLNLHPRLLEDLGLTAALRWYALEQAKRSGLEVTFAIEMGAVTLPSELDITLYRIAQEALTNIIRHSQARRVCLSLKVQGSSVVLSVKDDGRGFDLTSRGRKESLGLLSMRERASLQGGQLEVRSLPGQGTEVIATFPFNRILSGDKDR
jgi:PAS domain S-box-containing protein